MIRLRLLRAPRQYTEDSFDVQVGTFSIGSQYPKGYMEGEAPKGMGPMKTQTVSFSELYGDPEQVNREQDASVEQALRSINRQLRDLAPDTIEDAMSAFENLRDSDLTVHRDKPCTLFIASPTAPELDAWIPCEFYVDES